MPAFHYEFIAVGPFEEAEESGAGEMTYKVVVHITERKHWEMRVETRANTDLSEERPSLVYCMIVELKETSNSSDTSANTFL